MNQKKEFDTISIIGLGYIGLPTAAVFASHKVKVIGVDVSKHVVQTINRGEIHIAEPDLGIVVRDAVEDGYLRATTTPEPADAFLIAVPTPFKDGPTGPHQPDLDCIEAASRSIAPVLKRGDLVILESTSPVGATEQMAAWLVQERPDLTFPQTHGEASDIRLAHCPERVLPGQVLRELVQNDRVIGGMTPKCSSAARRLYKTFVQGECVVTNARTAEMCKLTENSFRDVNIAFANELSFICDKLSIDVRELIKLANRHPRVNILQPGPGVGGHCIAVDPWFIVSKTPNEAKLIHEARKTNNKKPQWVIAKIKKEIEKHLQQFPGKNIGDVKLGCYGLTFKANIGDLRESPALEIVKALSELKVNKLLIYEPNIQKIPKDLNVDFQLENINIQANDIDIKIILVAHRQFLELPKKYWENGIIMDICGLLD